MGQGQRRYRVSNLSHHAKWGRNEVRQNHVGRGEDSAPPAPLLSLVRHISIHPN